jgi:hypothetical protein
MEVLMHARDIISTHPDVKGNVSEALVRCVDECYACAQACTACADACPAEDMVQQLKQCIRLDLDCADVCAATGALAAAPIQSGARPSERWNPRMGQLLDLGRSGGRMVRRRTGRPWFKSRLAGRTERWMRRQTASQCRR